MSCCNNNYGSYASYNTIKGFNKQYCCLYNKLIDLSNTVFSLNNTINDLSLNYYSSNLLTIVESDTEYSIVTSPNYTIIPLENKLINPSNITFNNNQFTINQALDTRYFEISVNLKINLSSSSHKTFILDVSGVNNSFLENIDTRTISKQGLSNVHFGPLIIYPNKVSLNNIMTLRSNVSNNNHENVVKTIVTIKVF